MRVLKKLRWFVVIGLLGAGLIGGWVVRHRPKAAVAAQLSEVPSANPFIRVETVSPVTGGMARKTSQPGSAHSFESAEVFAKVSGYLKSQAVDIGSRVKKGDVLAEIDVPELAQELARERALLRQAEAEVVQAESNVKSQIAEQKAAEALVAQAQANIKRYESEREFRDKQYQRIRELFELNSIEERLVDEKLDQLNAAQSSEAAAHSSVLTAQQQALAAEARVGHAQAELLVAKAKVDVARAVLEKTAVLVNYMQVTSPYDGVVTARHYHQGAFIRSADHGGDVPLFSVDRIDVMRVVVQVPDRDVPYTQAGDKAQIVFDALPTKAFSGRVARVSASENPESRTMRVEIDLPNEAEVLRDGMYGQVEIELEPPAEGLVIPSSCLVGASNSTGAKVFVVADGKLRLTSITTGKDTGSEVEVTGGLTTADCVVAKPTGSLADGTPVDAVMMQTAKASAH